MNWKKVRAQQLQTFNEFKQSEGLKIALIGDSFCETVWKEPYKTWPYLVAEDLNAELIALGRGGTALLHSYEDLVLVVDEADYVILCITEPNRLANKYGAPLNFRVAHEFDDTVVDNIPYLLGRNALINSKKHKFSMKQHNALMNSAKQYYYEIHDGNVHMIIHKGILMQIDELLLKKKKKCFWFSSFYDSMSDFKPKSGPIGNIPLTMISTYELASLGLTAKQCKQYIQDMIWTKKERAKLAALGYPDTVRYNHFGSKYNKFFANMILDIIRYKSIHSREQINIADWFPFKNFNDLANVVSIIHPWIGDDVETWGKYLRP